jgi:glycosyltransferase involved in cell wall biosynthesis
VSQGYADRIAREKEANVVFRGPYLNRDIGSVLANIDMIVVPSLWFENSPLTIQEAFACGVPVITANAGGMAEMVRDGIDGLHFRIGDAADLREKLLYVIEHPQVLDTFRRNIPTVNTIARNAAEIRGYYERVAGESPVASINPQPATGIDPSV